MAHDKYLAERVRGQLALVPNIDILEKMMFGGLAFMVNGKMCINVHKERLMCRYDQLRQEEVESKNGYQEWDMKGKKLNGYCFVDASGFETEEELNYWIELCLEFNPRAKASKKC